MSQLNYSSENLNSILPTNRSAKVTMRGREGERLPGGRGECEDKETLRVRR